MGSGQEIRANQLDIVLYHCLDPNLEKERPERLAKLVRNERKKEMGATRLFRAEGRRFLQFCMTGM
jgi:hypothetical protein